MTHGLPSKDAILAACRGFPPIQDDPILDAALELAVLHQTREHTPLCGLDAIDAHRARLMSAIDCWVLMVTPVPFAAARVHTHTMGQVIRPADRSDVHRALCHTRRAVLRLRRLPRRTRRRL
ncbi:hypothetical protein ABZV58_31135 [Nocardia sp. NPDC004654]|uniref:hypothetical protein n=1 Tax=Nocardia sp. NPDC004654 TaxID=3154776 RepID=UPI0033A79E9B